MILSTEHSKSNVVPKRFSELNHSLEYVERSERCTWWLCAKCGLRFFKFNSSEERLGLFLSARSYQPNITQPEDFDNLTCEEITIKDIIE